MFEDKTFSKFFFDLMAELKLVFNLYPSPAVLSACFLFSLNL